MAVRVAGNIDALTKADREIGDSLIEQFLIFRARRGKSRGSKERFDRRSVHAKQGFTILLTGYYEWIGGVESWGDLVPRGYYLHSIVLGSLRPGIN